MKRHAGLIPLSHDHHDGLVIAQRLLQGASKSPQVSWPSRPQEQRDRVLDFYRDHLRHHFAAEEEIVFPLARRHLAAESELVGRLEQEHRQLRRGLEEMKEQTSGLGPALKQWAGLLRDHIRSEERELFQLMQSHVPEDELAACRGQVEALYARRGRSQESCPL
ncbi:MAG TPA: hemerythrin domain-containing protein [Acidobacteriota bacterium]|nr:hemerythrin domain-containing protein [Acidobacteriota bacterium]